MTSDSSDRLLTARLLRGDEEAFAQFFDAVYEPLFQSALMESRDDAAAEEMVRGALCTVIRNPDPRALRALRALRGEKQFTTEDTEDTERRTRVRSAVHDAWQDETTRRAKRRIVTAFIFLASLAAIVVAVNWPRHVDPIVTAAGTSQTVAWGGGTLRIEENTRVTLRSATVAILEYGTVYFASAGDPSGVIIHTPYGAVRDVGTRFEVRVADGEARVRVDAGKLVGRTIVLPTR